MVYDELTYAQNVLARAPKNTFRASLLWLVEGDAITLARPTGWTTSTPTAMTSATSSSVHSRPGLRA